MIEQAHETYVPGLEGVVAGETAISTVGSQTGLIYRGYRIEDLAERASFEEVAYLLLYGELPDAAQLRDFRARLAAERTLPETLLNLLGSIPAATRPIDVLRSAVSVLAHFDPDVDDNRRAANLRKAERLIAKLPTVLATRYRIQNGDVPLTPDPALDHPANLLYMMFGRRPTEASRRAMDTTLVLYAEHEFNASTFAARVTVSTLSDLHSGITSAVGTLKGPLHGGANEEAMKTLLEIGTPQRAEQWVRDALAHKRRIMGFGHRVYKTGDPRATILARHATELARETGQTHWEEIAAIVERVVRTEKKLPPNVDWPCGRLYYMMGLDTELYTPLFVLSRVAGWSAHIIEQLDHNRLIRPRARYVGPEPRDFVPLEARV